MIGAIGNAPSWACANIVINYTVLEATFGRVWPFIVPDYDLGCGKMKDINRLGKNVSFGSGMKHKFFAALGIIISFKNNSYSS
jgi:hypothetical protein